MKTKAVKYAILIKIKPSPCFITETNSFNQDEFMISCQLFST